MGSFESAFIDYDVEGFFQDILPPGIHEIQVRLVDKLAKNAFMTTVSSSIIMVSKEALANHSQNEIASAIGHELIHVNDDLRGQLDRFDTNSVNQSERRGYNWQWIRRREFSLDYRYKEFITRELAKLE